MVEAGAECGCPRCGYSLAGLAESARCPECGLERARQVAEASTIWSGPLLGMTRGVLAVLRMPRRTLALADWPALVPTWRAALFGVGCMVPLIAFWGVIKRVLMFFPLAWAWGDPAAALDATLGSNDVQGPLYWMMTGPFWLNSMRWEAWSVLRWWLLFGLLAAGAWMWRRRVPGAAPELVGVMRRLLLFGPWIWVLELGYLVGVWVESPVTVPETGTMFSGREWRWDGWLRDVWLIRGVVPTFGVGVVFFRAVAGWKWGPSLVGAMWLVPVGINLSLFWSMLYLWWLIWWRG